MTTVNKQWENLKNDYVHQVEKALSSVKHPRIKEVLEDVREHLDRRFWELSSEKQTIENLKSIIAEMGPASEYAELLEPQVVKYSHNAHKKYYLIAGIATIVVIAIAIPLLQPKHSTLNAAILSDKISKLDIDHATVNDVIEIFGKPLKYVWGNETYNKDDLPLSFIMCYPDDFSVYMSDNKIVELRHSNSENGYLWHGKLKVGYTLNQVLEIIGKPTKTIEGQENEYESGVLYKDIEGNKGHCYYARNDLNIRLWFSNYILTAIYMTRSDYGQEDEEENKEREKAVIPSTSIIDANERIIDKIDYSFENDPNVIGTWKSVDFVDSLDDFKPNVKNWTSGELYLKELIFLPGGKTKNLRQTWTKGLVLHSGDKTASKYIIKEIDGSIYMFFEWKSGDYTLRGMKPKYYVLKKE